jgi:hypothetical protein
MPSIEPRQAVVVIHGIGEQLPMETLRGFVEAVTPDARRGGGLSAKALSKPDYISPTLELRRMAVPGDDREWTPGSFVSTDFYELYWAHLMAGTAWHHVLAWVAQLLLRRPTAVPRRLRLAWGVSWIAVLLALAAIFGPTGPRSAGQWSLLGALAGLALLLCRSTGTYFGLQYAGDAARYLSPRPENVGVRLAIRSEAIRLLEGLHDDPTWRRYHRIVVVGHSLGSVIAYDALTHLWQRRHHPSEASPLSPGPAAVEAHEPPAGSEARAIDQARREQSAAWREQREIGVQWKITDFVTLGSPLAHAPFLMASDERDLEERVKQREYPTCPPQPNDPRDRQYGRDLLASPTGSRMLHHAAPFACTRWTNLYFDRDIIGGKIEHLGEWIDNRGLEPRGFFPHTSYWKSGADHGELLRALDLSAWWTVERNARVALETQRRDSGARPA